LTHYATYAFACRKHDDIPPSGALMTEPFWEWWVSMFPPVRIHSTDTLIVSLSDWARLPMLANRGFRGLDLLKAELKRGVPGVIIRKPPAPQHRPQV
jgi:hypothetical protein